MDSRTASILSVCRQITGREVRPTLVSFPYDRPEDVEAHREVFRSDLRFGEPTFLMMSMQYSV